MGSEDIDAPSAAGVLRAVSNPARLRIVLRLLEGERSVSELEGELEIRQPNLSQHLAELRNANLVTTRRKVKSVYYRLADDAARRLVRGLLQGFGVGPELEPAAQDVPIADELIGRPRRHAAVFAQMDAKA